MRDRIKEMTDAPRGGKMDRREFIHQSVLLAGGLAAAGGLRDD